MKMESEIFFNKNLVTRCHEPISTEKNKHYTSIYVLGVDCTALITVQR